MTVAAATPINSFVGNGSASSFSFTFPVFLSSQILVTVTQTATGAVSTLVLGTDYTVVGLNTGGDPATTGSISLVNSAQAWLSSGNLATGFTLVIQSNFALAQTTSIRNQGDFYRAALENALDTLEYQIQQLELQIGAQVILPTGLLPSAFSPILPSSLPNSPGLAIVVNSTGTGFGVGAGGSVTLPVTVAQGGTGSTTTLLGANAIVSSGQKLIESSVTSTQLGYLLNLFKYRRPNLVYGSSTTVTAEAGIIDGSASPSVLFPDGQVRTETASGLYTMTISQTAIFNQAVQASNRGGIRTGTVVSNTWYAVYAVKVSANSADYVLVADTVVAIPANFATLNSNFGTNSWVYLGTIRYGDGNAVGNAILNFAQSGAVTIFQNHFTATNSAAPMQGIVMVATASATSLSYSYVAGTGGSNIPANITFVNYVVGKSNETATSQLNNNGSTANWAMGANNANVILNAGFQVAAQGVTATNTGGASAKYEIGIYGFIDGALGVGPNPLF